LIIEKKKAFDTIFKRGSGRLFGIKIHPTPNHIAANAQTLDIKVDHDMFVFQTQKYEPPNPVSKPKTQLMFVPPVLSARPNRRTSTSSMIICPRNWEGKLTWIVQVSRPRGNLNRSKN
jgi:hypothetical protein